MMPFFHWAGERRTEEIMAEKHHREPVLGEILSAMERLTNRAHELTA